MKTGSIFFLTTFLITAPCQTHQPTPRARPAAGDIREKTQLPSATLVSDEMTATIKRRSGYTIRAYNASSPDTERLLSTTKETELDELSLQLFCLYDAHLIQVGSSYYLHATVSREYWDSHREQFLDHLRMVEKQANWWERLKLLALPLAAGAGAWAAYCSLIPNNQIKALPVEMTGLELDQLISRKTDIAFMQGYLTFPLGWLLGYMAFQLGLKSLIDAQYLLPYLYEIKENKNRIPGFMKVSYDNGIGMITIVSEFPVFPEITGAISDPQQPIFGVRIR